MIYLLIDTCTLLHLVSADGYNDKLNSLKEYIDNGQISLLTHQLLIEEWNKHKLNDINRKQKKLLKSKSDNEYVTKNNELIPSNIFTNINHLDLQIREIDKLLSEAKILITPDGIKNEFAERVRNELAPFHRKKNASLNDWEIIGSVCNYCEIYSINQLYFLSHNDVEFADTEENIRTIHPHIQSRFPKVKINYFKNYSDFFNELNLPNVIPHNLLHFSIIPNSKFSFNSTQKNNILDSLYFLFNELYKEVNFIPLHIIRRYYPFSESKKSDAHVDFFTLNITSDKTALFFDNIVVENNKIRFKDEEILKHITDYENKTEFVLKSLTNNLIFNIYHYKKSIRTRIHYSKEEECNCYACSFYRFDFAKTFSTINLTTEIDSKKRLKQAYVHYQIGNYKSAVELYYQIIEDAYISKNYLTIFISKHNLKHLGNFLGNFFFNKEIDNNIISKLKEIDLLEEAVKLKSYTDYDFISYIAKGDFFDDIFQNLVKINNEIQKHYYSQLNGGWSSNRNIWELIENFARIDTLLNTNFIIYDQYSDFERLFEIVNEGIFASHAMSEDQESKFEYFDYYWIHKFIVYGKRKTILSYFNKFHLKTLKYKLDNDNKDSFLQLAETFLINENKTRDAVLNYRDKNNSYFESKYNSIFENIVTMGALLELDRKSINKFSILLLNFLKIEKTITTWSFESVRIFINKKGKSISNKIRYDYLNYFMFSTKEHDSETLKIVINSFDDGDSLKISDYRFNLLVNQSITICQKCGVTHSFDILFTIFKKVSKDKQDIIRNTIKLKLKTSFSFELFYSANIYDIIELDKKQFYSIIDKLEIKQKNHTFRSIFSNKEDYQRNSLDQILNLCFKHDINLKQKRFTRLKKVHPYYEWLINMDDFDYKKFNPEWVLNYQTKYYFGAMSKSKNLKNYLVSFLKEKQHAGVENVLINISHYYN